MSAWLLDTHAWIWLAAGDRRLRGHANALTRAARSSELLLSAVSVYEAALIGVETELGRRRGKQAVRMLPTVQQWLRDAMQATLVVTMPLDADVAMHAATLQAMHPDPFDRIILATAASCGATLATADARMIAFGKAAGVKMVEL